MKDQHEDQNWNESLPPQTPATSKSSCGCVFYGCLITFVLTLILIVGGSIAGYYFFKGQVERYTSVTPADLPVVQYSEEELAAVQGRIEAFKQAIEQQGTPDDLVLTADDINALIAKDENWRGKVYVMIQDGQVSGQISLPTDFFPGGKGRYFNASASFDVSLTNGVPIVTLASAEVKGEKVPQQLIDGMKTENLAKDLYKDPEVAETLARFESLSIEHDRIILKAKAPPAEAPPAEATPAEMPPAVQVPEPSSTEAG